MRCKAITREGKQCKNKAVFADGCCGAHTEANKVVNVRRDKMGWRKNYRDYMRSDKWARKSKECLARYGYRCAVCNASAKNVVLHAHHRTYQRLGHERPDDLVALCETCHALFHKYRKIR